MGKLESLPLERKEESYQRRRKGGRGKETREKIRNKRKGTRKKKKTLKDYGKKNKKNRSPTLEGRGNLVHPFPQGSLKP